MTRREISFDSVRAFCEGREVDLRLVSAPPPCQLALQGEFDGYGFFFLIEAHGVEQVDLCNGVTVGELIFLPEARVLADLSGKWGYLNEVCSGPALVIRSADAGDTASATPSEMNVIVAERFVFLQGSDW